MRPPSQGRGTLLAMSRLDVGGSSVSVGTLARLQPVPTWGGEWFMHKYARVSVHLQAVPTWEGDGLREMAELPKPLKRPAERFCLQASVTTDTDPWTVVPV